MAVRIARLLAGPAWRHAIAPSIGSLVARTPSVTSHDEVLEWLGISVREREDIQREFVEVCQSLETAYSRSSLTCPSEWAVEGSTSAVLYGIVRSRKPQTVIETGIANGHSSFVILSALARNGIGRLASVDIREDTGVLVGESLAERWTRVIINGRRPDLEILESRLTPFMPFDVFFHDGDHRFLGQMLDYRVGSSFLTVDGIMLSDDIDVTSAWLDAAEIGLLPSRRLVLLDRRKAVGLAIKSRASASSL
jgi:predicted O-methyltransferase YrrM